MTTGLVVGKFAPLHLGHKYLIDTAVTHSDDLIIIHYGSDEVGVSSEVTHDILLKMYPEATIIDGTTVVGSPSPKNDAAEIVHRLHVAKIFLVYDLTPPDVVFTSETYGDPFSWFLSNFFHQDVKHHLVDIERKTVPISGTMIRSNPIKYEEFICKDPK